MPPAEAKGGDPLFRLVDAERDSRMAGVPADALGCLQRLQRTRATPAH
ncbi:MAG: hypothetical protein INR64_13205 [Caulobacteraceae bacterium]|nr:hypothetical protein [Caulobacter sp.]